MCFTSRGASAMTVNLHVTILIKEEHPQTHTHPRPFLKPTTSRVSQSRIVPEISAIKHSGCAPPPIPSETEISLLTVVGLLKLIKGVMGGPAKKGAPTGVRLRDERKGAIHLIIFVTSTLSSRRPHDRPLSYSRRAHSNKSRASSPV